MEFLSKRARVRTAKGKTRKALANSANSPLKGWEYPAGSDIRIREVINRSDGKDFGVSYRVSIPAKLAGRRILKQFADTDAAETWAQEQYKGLQKCGHGHFEKLSPKQRTDVQKALRELEGSGLSLVQAVRFAKENYQPKAASKTVKEAVEVLVLEKAQENLKPRSVRDLKNRLGHFTEAYGDCSVADVSAKDIERWLARMQRSDNGEVRLSARSIKNYTVTLRTFFNFAISKGWRTKGDNPADALVIPKIDWKPPAILSVEEAGRLITTARDFEDGKFLAYFTLGLFAGIRSSELGMLDWSHIDLDEGIVTIGADIAKKRRLRVIELMPNAVRWLRSCKVKSGALATDLKPRKMAEFFKAAGFANWREEKSNAMRHSFGIYHYALYQSAALTSAALGHREGDQVLFDSYRSLARKRDGEAYFAIVAH